VPNPCCTHPNTPNYPHLYVVDLPESHIARAVFVEADGMGVASALMRNDASAAGLIPGIPAAPRGDINSVFVVAAVAGTTLAGRTVAPAGVSQDQAQQTQEEQRFHRL